MCDLLHSSRQARGGVGIGFLLATLAMFAIAPVAAAARWVPPQRLTWYWQLTGRVRNSIAVAAYDIDGFENGAAEISALHHAGRHVICYLDVGTWESWRQDARVFPRSVLGRDNGWPGERWLDVRRLSVLEPIMLARLEMCDRKRFDAIEPDNIDGFENDTGFSISAREQLAYDMWIAGEAHRLGLAVFEKNDPEQARQLEPHFDGVLDEQCNQYHECSSFAVYLRAGKPVLDAEYRRSLYPGFCAADERAGIAGVLYDLELDGRLYRPCWTAARPSARRIQVGADQGRAAIGVDEPGAVCAGDLVERCPRDVSDRGPRPLGRQVGGLGSPDEHRRRGDRGELRAAEDAFRAWPAEVVDGVHQGRDGARVRGPTRRQAQHVDQRARRGGDFRGAHTLREQASVYRGRRGRAQHGTPQTRHCQQR
jgi:hypothetical protein